jgi:hypothetical protein
MPDTETVRTWQGRTLLDRDGSRIGTIDAIYLDDRTGEPEWALVNTGLFGTKASFVPLAQAFQSDNDVLVPYDKQLVRDAPKGRCRPAPVGGRGAAVVAPLRPGLRHHRPLCRHGEECDEPRHGGTGCVGPDD